MSKSKATKTPVETTGFKSKVNEPTVQNTNQVQIHLLYDSANPLHRASIANFMRMKGKPRQKAIRRFIEARIAATSNVN